MEVMVNGEGVDVPGRRVMIVDDHSDTVEAMETLLQLWGYIVRSAQRGQEALEVAREFEPDCAIIDLHLPDLSGYDVARTLRERGTPVTLIALSGDQASSRVAGGFDRHVQKPISAAALHHLIETTPRAA